MSVTDAGQWNVEYCFESTESMAAQLVEILGPSGWRMTVDKSDPQPRKSDGKFAPRS